MELRLPVRVAQVAAVLPIPDRNILVEQGDLQPIFGPCSLQRFASLGQKPRSFQRYAAAASGSMPSSLQSFASGGWKRPFLHRIASSTSWMPLSRHLLAS